MKFSSMYSVSPLEITVFLLFSVYIIFSVPTPAMLIPYINSNLGLGLVIILTLCMFFYATPVLGVLSILVAYELLRRSSNGLVRSHVRLFNNSPSQPKKDKEMQKMNPPAIVTLEEEVINIMGPVGQGSIPNEYIGSSYKPLQEKLVGAALF